MKSTASSTTSFVQNFLAGIRSIFDIGGVSTSREIEAIEEPNDNDYEAVKENWRAVGRGLNKAMNSQRQKLNQPNRKKLVTNE